jgi:general nucleoside transport system ATP-binding protein
VRTHSLVVSNVTKTFGTLRANDGVTMHVRNASVHAVLGENGAGKSTLMNILYGLYQPDSGQILVRDRPVVIDSPKTALRLGIGMVHQHFTLVGPLTVVENVVLGRAERWHSLDLAGHARRLLALSESFGFEIDPHQPIWRLPIGMQQRVEILKLLYHNADILIFDEPTSVLTPKEVGPFLDVLGRLRTSGKTILFVTHKLEEVLAAADRVTVMRQGKALAEVETATTTRRHLARLMVARDIVFDIRRPTGNPGPVILDVESVRAINDRGLPALDGLSLQVRAGEILGIAGVDGNGQSELAQVIAGLRMVQAGRIIIGVDDVTRAPAAARRRRHGLGYVPEDRHQVGLVLDHTVAENLVLRAFAERPFARYGFLRATAIRSNADRLVDQYDVRLQSVDQQVRYLSGGNQQKIILARELEARPKVLVVSQPTKGLDVGAIEYVQNALLRERGRGAAILYISTELEHLLAVSDRVAVIFQGRITGTLLAADATAEQLGLLMSGAREAMGP